MSEHLFDLLIACILLVSFGIWLLNRKTVKWLIRQWVLLHHGYHAMKRNRHHWPWASVPVFLWWVTGHMPWWVTTTRLISVSILVTLYKLYRHRQRAAIGKQRQLADIPKKEKEDETRRRTPDPSRVEEASECEEPAPHREPLTPEVLEEDIVDERPGDDPQPILPRHRVRRVRKNESSKPVE